MLNERTVLLVDETGMIGSADLTALIEAADAARAKLVLVGDHQQLGEIEAGGLYRALAERADPIVLDEMIRHNHDVDREAARMIREGEGRAALELYRSSERVTVAPDAEARREAMVADWHRAYSEGQDALMVAKRNVEVQRLNATAKELLRAERQLGAQEIEVGEARFAAGDQVITRVNDHANAIYNRERWQVEAVNAEQGRIVLSGIDQPRTVEVGPDYLSQTTLHGEAPALQHAYAVTTTYCAQGTTVDRAYVMADPSMDKQEMYVATSRSREETYLYATPEIQAERAEYAPRLPGREVIGHVAEAAERDRSQTAAHDEALHTELRKLPSEELSARREALRQKASDEFTPTSAVPSSSRGWSAHSAFTTRRSRSTKPSKGWAGARGWSQPSSPPAWPASLCRQRAGRAAQRSREGQGVGQGRAGLESYRSEHGIKDKDSALGHWREGGQDRTAHDRAQDRVREAQRRLERTQRQERTMQRSQEMSHGFDIGIG